MTPHTGGSKSKAKVTARASSQAVNRQRQLDRNLVINRRRRIGAELVEEGFRDEVDVRRRVRRPLRTALHAVEDESQEYSDKRERYAEGRNARRPRRVRCKLSGWPRRNLINSFIRFA